MTCGQYSRLNHNYLLTAKPPLPSLCCSAKRSSWRSMESEWALIFRGVKRILQVHFQWTGVHKARCTRCQTSRRTCLSVIQLLLCLMQQPEEDEANAEGSEALEDIQLTACPESRNSNFLFIKFWDPIYRTLRTMKQRPCQWTGGHIARRTRFQTSSKSWLTRSASARIA